MARPQEFDRNEVLKSALEVCQRQGYGATTVPDLVAATHLQPGSLYGAFKSKKGILLEALNMYADGVGAYVNPVFSPSDSALDGVRQLLIRMTGVSAGEQGRCGCLTVNNLLEMASRDGELKSC